MPSFCLVLRNWCSSQRACSQSLPIFFVVLKEVGKTTTPRNKLTRDTGQEVVPSGSLGEKEEEEGKVETGQMGLP